MTIPRKQGSGICPAEGLPCNQVTMLHIATKGAENVEAKKSGRGI